MPGTVDLSKSPWLGSSHASGVNLLPLFCYVVIAWTALSTCVSIPMGQSALRPVCATMPSSYSLEHVHVCAHEEVNAFFYPVDPRTPSGCQARWQALSPTEPYHRPH